MSKLMLVLLGVTATLSSTICVATEIDNQNIVVAREATEAPRGADNNNHRQRRGGKAIEELDILAREAGSRNQGRRGAMSEDNSLILAREGGCRRKCGA